MYIKTVIFGKSLSEADSSHNDAIVDYLEELGMPFIFYYGDAYQELLWARDLKRKEALVITTDKQEAKAAREAFCRCWLLNNTDEFTVDTVDEILHSTRFGL